MAGSRYHWEIHECLAPCTQSNYRSENPQALNIIIYWDKSSHFQQQPIIKRLWWSNGHDFCLSRRRSGFDSPSESSLTLNSQVHVPRFQNLEESGSFNFLCFFFPHIMERRPIGVFERKALLLLETLLVLIFESGLALSDCFWRCVLCEAWLVVAFCSSPSAQDGVNWMKDIQFYGSIVHDSGFLYFVSEKISDGNECAVS